MSEPKKRLFPKWEKILLIIAGIIILYFILTRLGISFTTVTEDTKIIDPYGGR